MGPCCGPSRRTPSRWSFPPSGPCVSHLAKHSPGSRGWPLSPRWGSWSGRSPSPSARGTCSPSRTTCGSCTTSAKRSRRRERSSAAAGDPSSGGLELRPERMMPADPGAPMVRRVALDHEPPQRGQPSSGPGSGDPLAMMRSRSYLGLLVMAAALGVPIAVVAYWFLKLTDLVQQWTFVSTPKALGFSTAPVWWPVLPLAVAGLCVGLVIRYLPGHGGESPADGFKAGGVPLPVTLPGIFLAAVASIGLGAVVGPEAPLTARGGGRADLPVCFPRRDVPRQTAAVIAATGSFAAISTLLGTPLGGAFLLLEASGLGGALATAVLLPGLLSAGVGALVFTGLDALTGYGTFSFAIPSLPAASAPTLAEFGWAVPIGLAAAILCIGLRWLALRVRDRAGPWRLLSTTLPRSVMAGVSSSRRFCSVSSGRGSRSSTPSSPDTTPRTCSSRARRNFPAWSATAPTTRSVPWSCSWSARAWPIRPHWPASAAARHSPPCSWALPAGSLSPTCPGCRWSPASPWGWPR